MSEESGLDDEGLEGLAESMGLVCFKSAPDLLLVDLDTPESYSLFADQYEHFAEKYDVTFHVSTSKSGNRHVYVKVKDVDFAVITRLAFQAALGSDPKREMLGIIRFFNGHGGPVLFETKDEAKKVKEFLAS